MGDFDFFVGEWTSVQRRLKKALDARPEWGDEFPGRSWGWAALGGAANIDEVQFPTLGWGGVSIRLFNLNDQQRTWTIYWISSRNPVMDSNPVIGSFSNGIGEFFGDDQHEGRKIRVRYIWSGITSTTAHWEQAFSLDKGMTWETNWVSDFTRTT